MRASTCLALLIPAVLLGLAGCGGTGEVAPPPGPDTSAIEGQVNVAGGAGDYELLLDGQPVPGALEADGSYAIEGVTPGRHRVAVVARDGMTGGYCSVQVPERTRARAPEIVPRPGGQIVGIVTRRDESGVYAVEGAEVTAQPAVMIAADEDGERPEIWPPPDDLPTFSAFTDANGSYLIRAVPPGEYVVTVGDPDSLRNWTWVWVEAGRTAVADFELRPEVEPGVGTVRGRVMGVRDGQSEPIAGARVTIMSEMPWEPIGPIELPPAPPARPADAERGSEGEGGDGDTCPVTPGPGDIMPPWFESVSTLTDEDGRYTLNAPSGWASIEVWMPGWQPAWEEIVIRPGETLIKRFRLEPWPGDWPQPGPPPVPLPPPDGGLEPPPPPVEEG